MNCRQFDTLLCDHLDGALDPDQGRALRQHAAQCRGCSGKLADVEYAVAFMRQAPQAEPPAELVADIIHGTIGVHGSVPALAGAGLGTDGSRVMAALRPLFHPFLQPRFAMSLAMALLSFSMLTFYSQGALERFETGKSDPLAAVRDLGNRLERVWEQGVQLYQTLQMFYELQPDFEEAPASEAAPRTPEAGPPESSGPAEVAPAAPPKDSGPAEQP